MKQVLTCSRLCVLFDVFFQGFVISDWQGIDRITDPPHANYSFSVQAGVLSGIDMVSWNLFVFTLNGRN